MKNKKNLSVLSLLWVFIIVSIVLMSCGPSISGTFSWNRSDNHVITFQGKKFSGRYYDTDRSGTYAIKSNTIYLTLSNGIPWFYFTIIDKNTLEDDSGDIWRRR